MLSHSNIVVNAMQNSYAFGIVTHALAGNISVLIGLPFFHSYGHIIMHTMTHLGFKQLLLPDARDTKSMVSLIKQYYPLLQVGVPTQFIKMLDEELKGIGLLGLSGSAPLPPEVEERFERKGAGVLMEGYGLSELSPVTHINTSVLLRLFGRHMVHLQSSFLQLPGAIAVARKVASLLGYRTVGRIAARLIPLLAWVSRKLAFRRKEERRATIGIPLPDTEVRFLATEGDRQISLEEMVDGGAAGELLLRGPQRMLGYWPEPGTGFDADGFIHTGDVVKVDPKGYFYIEDRLKDMIVVSGFKVYSRELDDVLYNHPAVAMAATFGIPDAARPGSEVVNAVVQLLPELADQVTEEDLIAYMRGKVAKYAVPKRIEVVDEMPLTEVYKVDKKLLRESRRAASHEGGS
jgi:acyl-CoA synthetase (AMP-forming)/AMP-acid ligase II